MDFHQAEFQLIENVLIKLDIPVDYIPKNLQLLLALQGLTSIDTIADISEDDVGKLEIYAREKLPPLLSDKDKTNFYGIYSKKPDLFEIGIGYKKKLTNISNLCKKALNKKIEYVCARCKRKDYDTKKAAGPERKIHKVDKNSNGSQGRSEETFNTTEEIDHNRTYDHIKKVVLHYIQNFINTNLEEPLKSEIFKKMQNLELSINNTFVSVKCILCEYTYKAYGQIDANNKRRWVMSNFNQHFKRHFKNVSGKTTMNESLKSKINMRSTKSTTLLKFLNVTPSTSNQNDRNTSDSISHSMTEEISIDISEDLSDMGDPLNNCLQSEKQTHTTDYCDFDVSTNNSILVLESSNGSLRSNLSPFPEASVVPKEEDAAVSERIAPYMDTFTINPDELEVSSAESGFEGGRITKMKVSSSASTRREPSKRDRRYSKLLLTYDGNQRKITEYFNEAFKKIEAETQTNYEIRNELISALKNIRTSPEAEIPSDFLHLLKDAAVQNVRRSKFSNRFDERLKLFSLYIFIIGGRLVYETLYRNLQGSLPSLTTLYRVLDEKSKITEGEIQMQSLSNFLEQRGYPRKCFVSEDQTAIVNRVRYDSKSNKMVGFTLSLLSNGFPEKNKYEIQSVKNIKKAFSENQISGNAYVFMAQPLVDKSCSFCMCIFGTDNKFKTDDVLHRWSYLRKLAAQHNIEIEGFASDGDTRCLKAMKIIMNLPNKSYSPYSPYFCANFSLDNPVAIQDTIHIATKIKTRLLNSKIILKMGNYFVDKCHIEYLIKNYPKDQHCLCLSYLEPTDKMNFEAIDKMSSTKVIETLKNIEGTEATRHLLLITRYVLDSFLRKDLPVERRVYLMWYSLFFVRMWRAWIKSSEDTNLSNNFITTNVYACLEINAHSLLVLIEKCRNTPQLFTPWLYSSQTCEKLFRQARSMTSTFSTVVNFDMYDMLTRLNRIQAINEITNDIGDQFNFPREQHNKLGQKSINQQETNEILPTAQLMHAIEQAKQDVIKDAETLGMEVKEKYFEESDILPVDHNYGHVTIGVSDDSDDEHLEININQDTFEEPSEDPEITKELEDLEAFQNYIDSDTLSVKDYSKKQNKHENTKYLKVVLNNTKKMTVKKSTLCWYFSNKSGRISSDRILRVRGPLKPRQKPFERKPSSAKKKNRKHSICSDDSSKETSSSSYTSLSEFENEYFSANFGSNPDKDEDVQDQMLESNIILLNEERYYAIFYDIQWYIGRIIKKDTDSCLVKFLKSDLDQYVWPTFNDIQTVKNSFIFHGPIDLQGTYPFTIKRWERNEIKKKFKGLKQMQQ